VQGKNGSVVVLPVFASNSQLVTKLCSVVVGRKTPYPQGWYSPVYDQYGPSPTLEYELEAAATGAIAWLIVPRQVGQSLDVHVSLDSVTSHAASVTYVVDGITRTASIPVVVAATKS
jgi:hypothetical protein